MGLGLAVLEVCKVFRRIRGGGKKGRWENKGVWEGGAVMRGEENVGF